MVAIYLCHLCTWVQFAVQISREERNSKYIAGEISYYHCLPSTYSALETPYNSRFLYPADSVRGCNFVGNLNLNLKFIIKPILIAVTKYLSGSTKKIDIYPASKGCGFLILRHASNGWFLKLFFWWYMWLCESAAWLKFKASKFSVLSS